MPGAFEYTVWLLCTLLEGGVLVCSLARHSFRRYFTLNLYMGASFAISIGRYAVLTHHGLASNEYVYFYYYSDAVLTICLYFALMGLYSIVFEDLGAEAFRCGKAAHGDRNQAVEVGGFRACPLIAVYDLAHGGFA